MSFSPPSRRLLSFRADLVFFRNRPMFLSAQYSLYTSSHPITPINPTLEIRVAPKSIYGKNALPSEAPHAFFSHFYGSSWHSDDSDFILFLGKRGKDLMWIGLLVVVGGAIRLVWMRRKTVVRKSGGGFRRLVIGLESVAQGGGVTGFQAAIAGVSRSPGSGTYQLLSFLPSSILNSPTSSPSNSRPNSPHLDASGSNILPVTFDFLGSGSSAASNGTSPSSPPPSSGWSFRRAADTYLFSTPATLFPSTPPSSSASDSSPYHHNTLPGPPHRRKSSRGLLFFVPAFFSPHPGGSAASTSSRGPGLSTPSLGRLRSNSSGRNQPSTGSSSTPANIYHASVPETQHLVGDGEGLSPSEEGEDRAEKGLGLGFETAPSTPYSGGASEAGRKTPPPLYERTSTPSRAATIDDEWDEWASDEDGGRAGRAKDEGN